MKEFSKVFPDTQIGIRINIDRNNAKEFIEMYNNIKAIFGNKKNVVIHPGILKGNGELSLNSPYLMNSEIVDIMNTFMRKGYPIGYPKHKCTVCTATSLSGYVIGPKGELYKCWRDVGMKEKEIGNISDNKFSNTPLLNKYMLQGSHCMVSECWECPLLPICTNDCARERLDNMYKNMKNDLCSIYKEHDCDALSDMLYIFYKSYHNSTKNENI